MNAGIFPQPLANPIPVPRGLLGYPSPVPTPNQAGHPDAMDWLRRVRAAGGDVSQTTQAAVAAFCTAIDAAGIRDRLWRLSLFCGSNLTAALVPLYRGVSLLQPIGNATDTNFNFVSGDYVESRGLKGNGTTKYLRTGLSTASIPTNCHLSYSGTSLELSGDRLAIGTYTGDGNNGLCIADVYSAYISGRAGRIGSGFDPANNTRPETFERHFVVSRTSRVSLTLYTAGRVTAINTTGVTPVLSTLGHYVFCLNTQGTPNAYTAGNLQMYSIGLGLSDAQVSLFSSAVTAFNSAMNRP